MTEATGNKTSRAPDKARQDQPAASDRIAELEAEIAALRRVLADVGSVAENIVQPDSGELEQERSTGKAGAVEAEVRHGREMAASRADRVEVAAENDALRRANAELAISRAALHEREERLRLILDSAVDYAIFSTDLKRRVTAWNLGAARLLGWDEAEIIGRSADIIFIPEDREAGAPEQETTKALAEGHARNERWHQRKDGSRFWSSGMVMPLRDPAAGPDTLSRGLLKVMRDQTERLRAEEALRESEARWRSVFERMQEGFALCEMVRGADGTAIDFRYLEVNTAWERLIGIPLSATVGRLASDIFPGIEEFWLQTYAQVVETGEPVHFEHCLGPLGRWFEVLAYRTEPGRFAALFLDMTERRRTDTELQAAHKALRTEEARLRLALEAGQLGFWELDVATDTALLSPRHDAIFGYDVPPPDWGYRRFVEQHLLPQDRDRVEQAFREAVESNAEWHTECRIRRADTGEVRWIEIRGQPLHHVDGRQVRLLGVVADITDRKRAEERRALLVGELNHRVKNTLTVVQSIAVQTARGATDLSSFSTAFQARLIALARAHDLLTRGHWEGATLDAVLRATLEPLITDAAQVDLSGCAPGVALLPTTALALTMAAHELATNARKYGALSVPAGRIFITCRAPDPGATEAVVGWTERGGPPIQGQPARRGFGFRLLQRGLAAEAGMGADIRFEREGLRCTLRLPLVPKAIPC
jgi:PAS domain S-box-containing protein